MPNTRINGLFAKGVHAKRFEQVKQAYSRKLHRMHEVLDFTAAFDITELLKENNYWKGLYKAESARSERKNKLIAELRTKIDELNSIEEIMTAENNILCEKITILNYKLSNK